MLISWPELKKLIDEAIEEECDAVNFEYNTKIDYLNKEVERARSEQIDMNPAMQCEIDRLREAKQKLQRDNDNLEKMLAETSKDDEVIARLTDQNGALEKELKHNADEAVTYREECERLKKECDFLRANYVPKAELDYEKDCNASLRSEVGHLKDNRSCLLAECRELKDENYSLKRDVGAFEFAHGPAPTVQGGYIAVDKLPGPAKKKM